MVDKIISPIGANELIIKVNEVIDAIPTAVSQLDNDSGFITGITSSDVTDALGFTPYDSSNPDGYITSAAISSLTDVNLTNLSNGEGLIYNSTSGKWENTTISGGGGTVSWGSITGTLADQTDLNAALEGKQATITGGASSITSNNLTGSRALVSGTDGKVTVSAITTTKLGYLTDVTSNIQAQINSVSSAIPTSTTQLTNDSGYITGITSSMVTTALGYTPYNSSNPSGYEANTINTIKVNGTAQTVTSKTVNITVPTSTTQLTNDSGYITGISSSDVTTALGYTPYSSANPSGYQANVIETIKVNNTAQTVTSKTVNITVPTNTTQLVNGSGYITGITSSMVTSALGFTPYSNANPSGYQANVIETVKVNGTALTPSSKAVDVTVPTDTSDLTNGAGFITSADMSGYQTTANLVTSVTSAGTDAQYPSAKAVYTATNANASAISTIEGKIPSAATSSNQLADKAFVNSSISTNTAYFIGTFNSVAELEAYSGTLTNNDYAFVATTDTAGNTLYDRYKYNSSTSSWAFEYELNNSSFTAVQWAAINSGITSDNKVTRSSTAAVGNSTIPVYVNSSGVVTTCAALNTAAYVANNTLVHLAGAETITGNKTFSGTVSLGSKATATTPATSSNTTAVATTAFVKAQGYQANVIETIKVNGTAQTVTSKAVDISVPTTTSSVTSGSAAALTSGGAYSNLVMLSGTQTITGNKTFSGTSTFSGGVSLGSSATATTPTVTSNDTTVATTKFVKDQGYQANVIETIKVNGTAQTVSSKAVNITVPTSTTQLTNDSGFITGINSSMVTAALGYTPYNSTNPNGYVTKSIQTVQDIQPITSSTTTMSDTISMYSLTPSSSLNNLTFNYTGTANKSYTFELMINMSSVQQVTFHNVTWLDDVAPDISTEGVYFLAFRKVGNSSIWYGNLQGKW